jgi:hypothetical protein
VSSLYPQVLIKSSKKRGNFSNFSNISWGQPGETSCIIIKEEPDFEKLKILFLFPPASNIKKKQKER